LYLVYTTKHSGHVRRHTANAYHLRFNVKKLFFFISNEITDNSLLKHYVFSLIVLPFIDPIQANYNKPQGRSGYY